MQWFWITFLILISDGHSIQTHVQRPVRFVDQKTIPTRNYRHIDTSTSINFDWEHGLREATLQALFREEVGDYNLRKHIYSAPLLGKQNKATPFGDIAILARGQLYANYAGYIFVQDPYQNDCDDCQNINIEIIKDRCINNHCQIWHPRNNEQLIALWSIKRIRHRSLIHEPNRLEIEFTISPTGTRYPKDGYLTKEGTFNYNLPGHVFLLKSSETHQNLDSTHDVNHFTHGAFIAQTPDGRKYILHSFPGILTPETPRYHAIAKDDSPTSSTTSTYYPQDDAKKVYQTLLEVLHKKTSLEPNRFTPTIPKTTTTISDTTLVQFPDGQVIPITELETPFITKTTTGYSTVRFPESTRVSKPVRPDKTTTLNRPFFKPSTNKIKSESTLQTFPQSYENIPTTVQSSPYNVYTTTQRTSFVSPAKTNKLVPPTISDTYSKPHSFYTKPTTANNIQRPSYHGNTQGVPIGTTNPPVKMTFHFFAAEEEKETSESPKIHLTTVLHNENQNFLSNTATPTETVKVFPSETTQYKIKTTESSAGTIKDYDTTRNIFTTISAPRPATVVKVTKPIPTTENKYSTNGIITYQPTKQSSKVTPPMIYEPSTVTHYTTKKPFAFPITVLEDISDATTTQEKHSTTQNKDVLEITHTPLTKGTAVTTNTMNPISTQFFPLTNSHLTTVSENTKSTRDYSTHIKVPTIAPTKENIETTLGVTKIMGASQNKTTEMIYYAAEENSANTGSSVPTTDFTDLTSSTIESTQPTSTVLETEPNTPKRIVTTIKGDGTVSVKTTPYLADEELFGLTKGSTKMSKTTKSYKVSTTEASDFLVEDDFPQDYRIPLFKKPLKDYSEDDIFGTTKQMYTKTSKNTSIRRPYIKSDLEEALFESNSTTSKTLIRRKSSATESTPPRVIYYDFFEASTLAMTTQPQVTTLPTISIIRSPTTPVPKIAPTARKSFGVSRKRKLSNFKIDKMDKQDENDKPMPVTSQSYLTSISFEVNKIKKPSNTRLKQNGGTREFENKNKSQRKTKETTDYKLDVKNDENITSVKRADAKGNDDFAFRLVSQAKSVAYLDKISTTIASTVPSISAKTTTKSKYMRRRSYVPRAKASSRKKVKSDKNK